MKETFGQWVAGRNDHSESFLTDLAKAAGRKDNDSTLDKLTASLILEVVPTAPLFSKALTHVVNFFLHQGKDDLRVKVAALAGTKTPQADAEVMKFVYEALSECICFVFRKCTEFKQCAKGSILPFLASRSRRQGRLLLLDRVFSPVSP